MAVACSWMVLAVAEHCPEWHRWPHAHGWSWRWLHTVMTGIGGGRMLLNGPGSGSSQVVA